jgi:hypothetical protein
VLSKAEETRIFLKKSTTHEIFKKLTQISAHIRIKCVAANRIGGKPTMGGPSD